MGIPLSTNQDYMWEGLLGPGGAHVMRSILGGGVNRQNNPNIHRMVTGLDAIHRMRGNTPDNGQTVAIPDLIDTLLNGGGGGSSSSTVGDDDSGISWAFLITSLYEYLTQWDVFYMLGTRMFGWDEETTDYNFRRLNAYMTDVLNAENNYERVLIFYEFANDVYGAVSNYWSNRNVSAITDGGGRGDSLADVDVLSNFPSDYDPSTSEGPSSEDGIIDARRRVNPPSDNSEEDYAMEPRGRYDDSQTDFSQIDLSEDLLEDIITWVPRRYNFEQYYAWIKKKNKEFGHIYVSA